MQIENNPNGPGGAKKPYCLVNSDGSIADCFATHAEAVSAMKDTTKASRMYSEDFNYSVVPFQLAEGDDLTWIEALQARTYNTPAYGEVVVTTDKLNNFVKNFNDNVRGIEISTDYEHGRDVSKGSKASGTVREMKVDGDKLLYGVSFTDTAKQEIKDGEWKYFSADWLDTYVHEDGTTHNDVVLGGGLTNRPVAKGLSTLPINFSEYYNDVIWDKDEHGFQFGDIEYQFATLTAAQRNALPNSQFLYIEPNGTKHLPVPDEAHIRNAISRLSQSATGKNGKDTWLTDSLRSSLLAKARALLSRKQAGEDMTPEQLKKLCEQLGIEFSEDNMDACLVQIGTKFTELNTQLQPFLELEDKVNTNRAFAEQYPEEFARMQRLEESERNRDSKEFSEKVGSMRFSDTITQKVDGKDETVTIKTSKGLSSKCLDSVQKLHKSFSDGSATATQFETVMSQIFDNGIVDYGEAGTSVEGGNKTEPENGGVPTGSVQQVRQQFAELVTSVKGEEGNDKLTTVQATAIAAERNPQLFEAYMGSR